MKTNIKRRIVCIIVMLSLVIGLLPLLKIQISLADNSSLISARINGLPQQGGSSLQDVITKSNVLQVTSIDVIAGTVTSADLTTISSYKATLDSLKMGETVTTADIPDNFLSGTSGSPNTVFKSAVLPKVTAIGANAFAYCTALANLSLGVTPPTVDATSFANCTASNKMVHVPTESITNYDSVDSITNTLWNGFIIVANIVTPTKLDVSKGDITITQNGAIGLDPSGAAVSETTLNPLGYEIIGVTDQYSIAVEAIGTQQNPVAINLNGVAITTTNDKLPLSANTASFLNITLTGNNTLVGGLKAGTVTVQGTGSLSCEGKAATTDKIGGNGIQTDGVFTLASGTVEAKGGSSAIAVNAGGNGIKVNGLSLLGGNLTATGGAGVSPDKIGVGIWNLGATFAIDQSVKVNAFGSKSIAFGINASNGNGTVITSTSPATIFSGNFKTAITNTDTFTITKDTTVTTVTVPKDMSAFATTVTSIGANKLSTNTTALQHTIGTSYSTDFNVETAKLNCFMNIEKASGTIPPVDPTKKTPTVNVTVTPASDAGQVTFSATVTGETTTPVTGQVKYQVDYVDLVTVDIVNGVVPTYNWKPTQAKKHTITAIYTGDTNYNTITKNIEYTVPKVPQISFKFIDTVKASYTYGDSAFNARAGGQDTNGTVTYVSSNDKVLAVDATGLVTIKGVGTATIKATKAGNELYSDASVTTANIVVNKKELTATAVSKTATVGGTLPAFTATVTGFAYTDTETTLASAGYKAPTVTCAGTTAKAETFDIKVDGGTPTANYQFKYVDGKFTVSTYTPPTNITLENTATNTSVTMADGSSFASNITFSVEDVLSKIPKKDMDVYKKNIDAAAKGKIIITLHDMKLMQNGTEVQPSSKVIIKIKAATTYDKFKDLQVAYIDKYGKVTLIPAEVKDGYITFTTDHFSNYAVIGTATASPNPATGDHNYLLYLIFGSFILCGIFTGMLLKNRKRT